MLIYAVTLNIFSIPCNRNNLIKIIQFMFAKILHWRSNRGTAYCYATGIAIVTYTYTNSLPRMIKTLKSLSSISLLFISVLRRVLAAIYLFREIKSWEGGLETI